MSRQKELLREVAAAHNTGAPDRISDWFTEDFRLHEPGAPALPVGHEGGPPDASAVQDTRAADKTGNPRYDRGGRSGRRAQAADRDLCGQTL
jgi:hypothetical protein